MSKLTPKQQLFVTEYLTDMNATQAAIRAGYSRKNADKIGSELLGKTRVFEAIQTELQKRLEMAEINQNAVYQKLADIIRKPASDCPGSDLRYSSQLRALELAAKCLGLLDQKQPAAKQQPPEDDGFLEALRGCAAEVWADYDPNDP